MIVVVGDTQYADMALIIMMMIHIEEAMTMIFKHPCMVVGQPVVPTLVHSSCDPGIVVGQR